MWMGMSGVCGPAVAAAGERRGMILVDTDVLIWHLRGLPAATERLDRLPQLIISAVTWMELLQGFRSRAEMSSARKSFKARSIRCLPIAEAITERAVALMEMLALSRQLRMGDALIAATALEHRLTVLSANTRHFTPIPQLATERFVPTGPGSFSVHERPPPRYLLY